MRGAGEAGAGAGAGAGAVVGVGGAPELGEGTAGRRTRAYEYHTRDLNGSRKSPSSSRPRHGPATAPPPSLAQALPHHPRCSSRATNHDHALPTCVSSPPVPSPRRTCPLPNPGTWCSTCALIRRTGCFRPSSCPRCPKSPLSSQRIHGRASSSAATNFTSRMRRWRLRHVKSVTSLYPYLCGGRSTGASRWRMVH